jgi:hypothetical protein
MPTENSRPHHRRILIRAVPVFLAVYLVSLLVWIQVKDFYSFYITTVASHIIGFIKSAEVGAMIQSGDAIQITFSSPFSMLPDMLVDIPVKTSTYTFNAPLTLGILASMYGFITRRARAFCEALILLLFVHLLYVMSLELKLLTEAFIKAGIEPASNMKLFFFQFLWGFTDNMVIRFEPFLIGFYIFIRFRRP